MTFQIDGPSLYMPEQETRDISYETIRALALLFAQHTEVFETGWKLESYSAELTAKGKDEIRLTYLGTAANGSPCRRTFWLHRSDCQTKEQRAKKLWELWRIVDQVSGMDGDTIATTTDAVDSIITLARKRINGEPFCDDETLGNVIPLRPRT